MRVAIGGRKSTNRQFHVYVCFEWRAARARAREIHRGIVQYIHTYNNKILIAKRGPGAKKRENFTGAARSFQIS